MTTQPSDVGSPKLTIYLRKEEEEEERRKKGRYIYKLGKLKGFQLLNPTLPETEPHPCPKLWKSYEDVPNLLRKKTKREKGREKDHESWKDSS